MGSGAIKRITSMRVTVLGLGAMGSRIAYNLLNTGSQLTAWNRSRDAAEIFRDTGAYIAATPREAVEDADFVISMVRDDPASEQIWLEPEKGALKAMQPDAVAIESSTCTVSWIRRLARNFDERGIAFLDAPVVGSRRQAEEAQLIHIVGGDELTLTRARPLLACIGSAIHHAGPTSSGAAMKLLVNALLGIQVASLAELLPAIENMGLDLNLVVDILGQSPPCSQAALAAAKMMVTENFSPAFPIHLMEKDLIELKADNIGRQTPVSDTALTVFSRAVELGYGEDNMTGVAKLYRRD